MCLDFHQPFHECLRGYNEGEIAVADCALSLRRRDRDTRQDVTAMCATVYERGASLNVIRAPGAGGLGPAGAAEMKRANMTAARPARNMLSGVPTERNPYAAWDSLGHGSRSEEGTCVQGHG